MTPEQAALAAAADYERWAAERRKQAALYALQPLPGVHRMSFIIPTEWGAPTFAYQSRAHGLPVDVFNFANGERIVRLRVKVSGDDDQPQPQESTTT